MVVAKNKESSQASRQTVRYRTHVLVELKKYRWLPFFSTYSGVVVDISESGFKVAFTGHIDVRPHTTYKIRIPLSPLGMNEPRHFESDMEVKWFDRRNYKLGGLFVNLSEDQKTLLTQVVEAIKSARKSHKQSYQKPSLAAS